MKTKEAILRAGLMCARKYGLYAMTRVQVATQADKATGTVSFHFGSMKGLRTAIVKHTIEHAQYLDVLAQALSQHDYHAVRAPEKIKRAALDTLT